MNDHSNACIYQPSCPGCPRFSTRGLGDETLEQLSRLARLWGCDAPPITEGRATGYRHRVRLSLRGKPGSLAVGIFEARSHRLVHIPACPLHHPSVEAFLQVFLNKGNSERIVPYNEGSHTGLVRALQLAVEPSSGKVQAVILVRDDLKAGHPVAKQLGPLLEELQEHSFLHSLWLGALPKRTNTLSCETYEHLSGPTEIEDFSGEARVSYPPSAFGQANPHLHEKAVRRIHEHVRAPSSVTEYYAGVGTIGLGLVKEGHRVTFNEVGTGSLEGLRQGLSALGIGDVSDRILVGTAGNFAESYESEDTVIVDPPRKGLDPTLLSRFLRDPPQRLIYLSCGIDSLLRECDPLVANGKTRLVHIEAFVYFPFTHHVETLLVLDRKVES